MDQIFVLHADMHSKLEGFARYALLVFLHEMRHAYRGMAFMPGFRPSSFPR